MYIRQISIYLENKSGTLAEVTDFLFHHGVNLRSLSIADTEDFGILRCIASDTDAAVMALRKAGYTAKVTDVLAVAVHAGMTTEELGMLDLAYAPPFASVWDAVHIAANAAK